VLCKGSSQVQSQVRRLLNRRLVVALQLRMASQPSSRKVGHSSSSW
jgi:hypothetical protein